MTQDKNIEMPPYLNASHEGDDLFSGQQLIAAVLAEREACAKVCDSFYLSWIGIQGRYEFMGEGASECAGAIRARGQA